MSDSDQFRGHLSDGGRLVLPAEIRKRLNRHQGDELHGTLQPDGSLRLISARQVVKETRGLYRSRVGNRSLADELIAERRSP